MVELAMLVSILRDVIVLIRKIPQLAEFTKTAEKVVKKDLAKAAETSSKGIDDILKKLYPKEPSKVRRIKDDFDIDLFQKKSGEPIQVLYKDIKIYEGDENALKKWLDDLDNKNTANRKKFLEEEQQKKIDDRLELDRIREVPSLESFIKWFDDLSIREFDELWKNEELRSKVISRLRHPGGLHEWLMVARTPTFKKWRISANQIKELRTSIDDVIFTNPSGKHGGLGSTKAHNEILKIIDGSKDFIDFKKQLLTWADKRLQGGSKKLPKGFHK
jgi:hypothetical protein